MNNPTLTREYMQECCIAQLTECEWKWKRDKKNSKNRKRSQEPMKNGSLNVCYQK